MLSTTLLGTLGAQSPLMRSGACVGDGVYVAGTLGKSAAGLWLLMNHPEDAPEFPALVDFHLNPSIEEDWGETLVREGVNGACMDISDGLSSELNHIALSSGVMLEISEDLLPIDPEVCRMSQRYGLNSLDFAMNGGEEYGLLFSCSYKNDIFQTRIGSVLPGTGVYMKRKGGEKVSVNAQAWSHL